MVVTYTQESGFQRALIDTFTGERLCGLCKIISADDMSDSDAALPYRETQHRFEVKSPDVMDLYGDLGLSSGLASCIDPPDPNSLSEPWSTDPPVPPPRQL